MKLHLKEIRESHGLSTYKMAELMEITQSSYSRFERSESKIDLLRLENFANALGMSLVDVIVYPEHFINVKDVDSSVDVNGSDVFIKLKVKANKKDSVLRAVLGLENVELLFN